MSGIGPRTLMPPANSVDQYIRAAPVEARAVLRTVRAAIREAAPDAEESISYGIPFYSYRGETGVAGRLCYFGLKGAGIALYLRAHPITSFSPRP
jgi:uncharacterized protein YdhG (YjbR/CyaY superfamily)